MKQSYSTGYLSPAVRAVGELHLEGNITPHTWYQCPRLQTDAGVPNLVAIVLLSELLYWHRPVVERDAATGAVTSIRNKFRGERYQANYAALALRFGLTRRQVQDNVSFLVRRGVICREIIDKVAIGPSTWTYNVVYLTLEPDVIREICAFTIPSDEPTFCHPLTFEREGVAAVTDGQKASPRVNVSPLPSRRDTPPRSSVTPPPAQTCAIEELEIPRETPNKTLTTTRDKRKAPVPQRTAPLVVDSTKGSKMDIEHSLIADEAVERLRRYTSEGAARAWIKRWGTERCGRQAIAFEGHLSEYALRGESVRNPAGLLRQAILEDWEPSLKAQQMATERAATALLVAHQADAAAKRRAIAAQQDEMETRRLALLTAMEPQVQARLDEAIWIRAWQDAAAPPIRNRIVVAAKSQEKVGGAVMALLKRAKSAILDEIATEGEEALTRYEVSKAFMTN